MLYVLTQWNVSEPLNIAIADTATPVNNRNVSAK